MIGDAIDTAFTIGFGLLAWIAVAAGLLLAGYLIGRIRPAQRLSDWANWQIYGKRPTGPRWWLGYTVRSAQNIGWLIAHPVKGVHAWKHRNDPPPPRSPALQFRTVNRTDDQEV